MTTEMTIYAPTNPLERAQEWMHLSPDTRRRRAMEACQNRDRSVLISLMVGYLLIRGRARAQVSTHTIESYTSSLDSLLTAWSQEQLLHPSSDAGDRFVEELSRSHKPATVASRLAGVKTFYKALQWAKATTDDPFRNVTAPRDPTPRDERRHPYSDEDVTVLLHNAVGTDRLLILLCAHAGLRIDEALHLRWEDADTIRGTLRVVNGKGRKARAVTMSATLIDALRANFRIGGYVITGPDMRPYADATVPRRHLQRLCAKAGVTYMGFHSLRHTAGTRLARQTGNIQLVAAHLGHADISTATIYARWADTQLQDAVGSW